MISFIPEAQSERKLDILCLGAHCDDIEIGCGGTLLKWIGQERIRKIIWVVFSADEKRKNEALSSANQYLETITDHEIFIMNYRDAFLSYSGLEIKEDFERIRSKIKPDIIFTHCRNDRHQDHRLLSDLTWNTFRNHLILEYEIPKYDGDLGNPNAFVAIKRETAEQKISLLMECFISQTGKHWFDEETFKSLMRIRGLECGSPTRYAESFYIRKCLI